MQKCSIMETKKRVGLVLLAAGLVFAFFWIESSSARAPVLDNRGIEGEQKKAERLVEKLRITEVLGPLSAVALSPFFGLTCLSGTSILCNKGVLPENEFLMGSETLNNGFIFLVFLTLTVITSAPKLVTASKIFAEATDRVETYAGTISYIVILMLAGQGQGGEQETVVYSAGVITITQQGLLACAAAVNIFIISTVRFFFELLVLISPIPTLDAIFELANKAIAGVLAAVYAFNPWAAFVLNLILFGICLLIFRWVNRRVRYLRAVLLDPVITGIKRRLIKGKGYDPARKLTERVKRYVGGAELAVKCFASKKIWRIKKKDLCYLVFGGGEATLVKPRFLKPALIRQVDRGQILGEVEEGLMTYSVDITDESGKRSCKLVFGRAYKQNLEDVKSRLNGLKGESSV